MLQSSLSNFKRPFTIFYITDDIPSPILIDFLKKNEETMFFYKENDNNIFFNSNEENINNTNDSEDEYEIDEEDSMNIYNNTDKNIFINTPHIIFSFFYIRDQYKILSVVFHATHN